MKKYYKEKGHTGYVLANKYFYENIHLQIISIS
jgi:hypothetical protein